MPMSKLLYKVIFLLPGGFAGVPKAFFIFASPLLNAFLTVLNFDKLNSLALDSGELKFRAFTLLFERVSK